MPRRRKRRRKQKADGLPSVNGTAQALAPEADPAEPGDRGPHLFWLSPPRTAGVRVNEDTALTVGAVFACVRVISETLAGLPWQVYERLRNGGRRHTPDHPSDWLIHTQANPETPAFQFRETLIAHALTWGNGYAEVERDLAGRPVWLWQITPDRVEVVRDARGRLVYDVSNPRAPNTVLPLEDVYHLRGLGFDGLVGYSVIRLAAREIGAAIAMDENSSSLFANDSTPGGLLRHPGRLSEQAKANLRETWNRVHQGSRNRRNIAILEEGVEWVQTGLPPEDMQLIQGKQLKVTDICRWFRVPPHKVADLTRSSFSNIESEEISFVTDTIWPWARRLESEGDIKLLGRNQRGRQFTRVNLLGLLRGDAEKRSKFYQILLDRGVYSVNDVLELEDRNPIGSDGDKRFVPLNMQLLDRAGEEPAPPPAPPAGGPPDDDEEEQPPPAPDRQRMARALEPVFEDALQRLGVRDSSRIQSAVRRGADLGAWFEREAGELHAHAVLKLGSPCQALGRLLGASPAAVRTTLALYIDERLRRIREHPNDAAEAFLLEGETRAAALDLMHRILAASVAEGDHVPTS